MHINVINNKRINMEQGTFNKPIKVPTSADEFQQLAKIAARSPEFCKKVTKSDIFNQISRNCSLCYFKKAQYKEHRKAPFFFGKADFFKNQFQLEVACIRARDKKLKEKRDLKDGTKETLEQLENEIMVNNDLVLKELDRLIERDKHLLKK